MAKGSRKAYYGILALAGLALAADRIISGGGPRSANADAPLADDLTVRPEDRPGAPLPRPSTDTAASRLAAFEGSDAPAGDLAAVPDWLRPRAKPADAAPKLDPAWEQRRVSRVSRVGQAVGVTIDGKFFTLGDKLDGMTLSDVDTDRMVAIFRGDSGSVELPLPARASENARPAAAGPK